MITPAKIISGGQTGADQAALRAALTLGIPTGGWAPKHFRTETEEAFWLGTRYGLKQTTSPNYTGRTALNVQISDATVLFGDLTSLGSRATLRPLLASGKPYLENPTPSSLRGWYARLAHQFKRPLVVNVAGNRESRNPGMEDWVYAVILQAWGDWEERGDPRPPSPVWSCPEFAPEIPQVETLRAQLHYVIQGGQG